MDNLFFQDKNQIYKVNLHKEAYNQIIYYCDRANPYEIGSVLIGNYSLNQTTANILQITPPPKDSIQAKYNFHRGSSGLIKVLDTVWNQGQYYLGEWHYHPNMSSFPSSIDKKQMMILSQDKRLKCPEPILIIIGGHKGNWNINVRLFANNKEIILYNLSSVALK